LKRNEYGLRRGIDQSLDRSQRIALDHIEVPLPCVHKCQEILEPTSPVWRPGHAASLPSRRRNSTPENGNRTLVPARCPYSVPSPSRAANLARLKWRTCLAGLKRRAALLTFRLIKRRLKNSGRLPQVSGPLSFQRRQSPLRRLLCRQVPVGRC
jgi:hypothetical protein